jgi:uncharacterized YigZ family protein
MYIPRNTQTARIERKNSHFIASALPVQDEEEAKTRIEAARQEHPKADHVVWAYRIDSETQQQERFSDDGEPGGTAGKPVMSIIHHGEFTNILITVVRYFGGTKLGKGGLVRAYTDSAREAVKDIPRQKLVRTRALVITLEYHFYELIRSYLETAGAAVQDEEFGEKVQICCSVPVGRLQEVAARITDISNGTAQITHPEETGKST